MEGVYWLNDMVGGRDVLPYRTVIIPLQIHNNNVGADLFDVFVADVAVVVRAKAGEPFATVGDDDFFDTAGAMVKFKVYDITDAVTGF